MNIEFYLLEIINMDNIKEQIEPYFNKGLYPYDCAFKAGKFILCSNIYDDDTIKRNINDKENDHYIWIYSTSGEGAKGKKCERWTCENLYKIPRDFEVINISKY